MSFSSWKSLYFVLNSFIISQHVCCTSRIIPGASFTKEHSRMRGNVIKSFVARSHISCAHACVANPRCLSTNFNVKHSLNGGLCELNNDQTLDSHRVTSDFYQENGFVYSRFPKSTTGDCRGICTIENQNFVCSGDATWTGKMSETKISAQYNFTTLGSMGRDGPDDNAGYAGTTLELVTLDDGKQEWNIPFTGRYRVEACGASGGDGFTGFKGGRGARVSGAVDLRNGERLVILVGQKGSTQDDSHPGGGGGGTFVVYASTGSPLLVAGGGGGGGPNDGLPGNSGRNGSGRAAGGAGQGGAVCGAKYNSPNSGSGGGCYDNGGCYVSQPGKDEACVKQACDKGGESFPKGGEGGKSTAPDCDGGFGGGGACDNYPGGGGGYSGGGVELEIAGGGGSFQADSTWTNIIGDCDEGDGYVTFIREE